MNEKYSVKVHEEHMRRNYNETDDVPSSLVITLRDVLMFSIAAIIFGMLLDIIFPIPKSDEPIVKTVLLLFSQILISAMFIFIVGYLYTSIFGRDPNSHLGMTVFILIFFLLQSQLFTRLSYLWFKITGKKLIKYINFN